MRTIRVAVVVMCALFAASARAATPTVTEFTAGITPTELPQSIAAGPDGNLWFTELTDPGRIGRITPAGTVTEFTGGVASGFSANSGPFQIAAGPDGNMWFTENIGNRIGRITPSGVVTQFSSGLTASAGLQGIAAGPDGNLWFAEGATSKIGRITPAGVISEYPTLTPNADPIGITAGPDGTMYFGEANLGNVGSITTGVSPTVTETAASDAAGQDPGRVAAGVDGQIWFTDFNAGIVGASSAGGGNDLFGLAPGTQPSGITSGPDGAIWFTETGHDAIGRITTGDVSPPTVFTSGITTGAAPYAIATGPDGNLWFAEAGRGAIGRITTSLDPPRFTAPARIDVPGSGTSGPASPYPSTIAVSGLQGTVTRVRVRLNGLFLQRSSDLEALLVGPQGQSVVLVSEPAPPDGATLSTAGTVMTFADGGATLDGQLVSGVFAPREFFGDPNLPAPAPSAPHGTGLSTFSGTNPNGTWSLYVNDPASNDTGEIVGGWSLDVDTTGPPATTTTTTTTTVPGPTIAAPADTTPAKLTLANVPRKLKLSRFLKGFKIRITPNEPAAIAVALTGTTGKATLAAVRVSLFERSFGVGAGTRTVTVKPARAAVGKPRKAFKVRLRIVATDRGGNVTPVDRTITVTPDKKKKTKRPR